MLESSERGWEGSPAVDRGELRELARYQRFAGDGGFRCPATAARFAAGLRTTVGQWSGVPRWRQAGPSGAARRRYSSMPIATTSIRTTIFLTAGRLPTPSLTGLRQSEPTPNQGPAEQPDGGLP